MRKLLRKLSFVSLVVILIWFGSVLADRNLLGKELIRLHVVADSNEADAQHLKLQVRDAVIASLEQGLCNAADVQQARRYIQNNLAKLEKVVDDVISREGYNLKAQVTLEKERFPVRNYDTFRLPAGVYESLRIVIGEGEGKNWWCVVFPALCVPATAEGFEEAVSCAGFSESLTAALEGKEGYELRFWVLDALGRLENLLHAG